jgi:hypothetical protein
MIVALALSFKVAHTIATIIVENFGIFGALVALAIIYRVGVIMEHW